MDLSVTYFRGYRIERKSTFQFVVTKNGKVLIVTGTWGNATNFIDEKIREESAC